MSIHIQQSAQALFGVSLTPSQLNALQRYEQELIDWNSRFNLTAIRSPEEIAVKHFLDSLSCMLVMRDTRLGRVIDVGTGAGFPGLVLKIINPAMGLTLVESVGKKANFCEHVVQVLKLEGVEILTERAETAGHKARHRQSYDWAVGRAVAILPSLAEYLLPLVKVGGFMLAMKGQGAHAEAQSAENALRILGGRLQKIVPVALPGVAEEHHLVVVAKTSATPSTYPRRIGLPVKKPLE
jgi:16S rRNA (guanine527-N7)-methyltransferase